MKISLKFSGEKVVEERGHGNIYIYIYIYREEMNRDPRRRVDIIIEQCRK